MSETEQLIMEGMQRIQERFMAALVEREQRLAEMIEIAQAGASRRERLGALDECRSILHKVAGTAGTLGYSEMGEGARYCEEAVRAHVEDGGVSAECMFDLLGRFMDGVSSFQKQH